MSPLDEIDARALLRARIRTSEGDTRTRAVLPFFAPSLDVSFLLVVLSDNRCAVTTDLPQRVARRALHYPLSPSLDRSLADVDPWDLEPLLHFDPWWLLRNRTDLPEPVCRAAMATNIAETRFAGRMLRTIYFDEGLTRAVAARVEGGFRGSRVVGDDLLGALRAVR